MFNPWGEVLLLLSFLVAPSLGAKSCDQPLGMQSGEVDYRTITASSFIDDSYRPYRARLHWGDGNYFVGGWCAATNNPEQYIQVDFLKAVKISDVATQGVPSRDRWLKKYKLGFSQDGGFFTVYKEGGKEKEFVGNTDSGSVLKIKLLTPVLARYIRIIPKEWQGGICTRLEFYGCREGFTAPAAPKCLQALGLQSRALGDKAFRAFTDYNSDWTAARGRLYNTYCWLAKANNQQQWFQVNFGKWVKIARMSHQGRQDANQWIKKFTITYSYDGVFFYKYKKGGKIAELIGNKDRHSIVTQVFDPPIITRYIRVNVLEWQSHIALRAEFYGCEDGFDPPKIVCRSALGIEDNKLPDSAFTASSQMNANYAPKYARLNHKNADGDFGGWCPQKNDLEQWLQIDLGKVSKVTAIATQGRDGEGRWTIEYRLMYSLTGGYYMSYKTVLKGNVNQMEIGSNLLEPAIIARYIRIFDVKHNDYMCLRLELFGCQSGFTAPAPLKCEDDVGLENMKIPDSAMLASTEANANWGARNARLNVVHPGLTQRTSGGWLAGAHDVHQWLQINFGQWTQITRIATQGRWDADNWVTKYSLLFSYNGVTFRRYKQGSRTKVFVGNTKDRRTPVTNLIDPPLIGYSLRIHPEEWHGHIAMRVGLYGCTSGFTPPDPGCTLPLGVSDRDKIPDSAFRSTTQHNADHAAKYARLNHLTGGGDQGGWCSSVNDVNQYLEIDLGNVSQITAAATQGRYESNWWTTKYEISYSLTEDGYFTPYQSNKKFSANINRNGIESTTFNPPIFARFVRFHPQEFSSRMCLRVELYGCKSGFKVPKPPKCESSMGLESVGLKDVRLPHTSMIAFSERSNYFARNARLNAIAGYPGYGGWWPTSNDLNQWLQVNLNKWTKFTRILTQGLYNNNYWVKKYGVSSSNDGVFFIPYKKDGKEVIFEGNKDRLTTQTNVFNPAFIGRSIRIHPKEWNGHIGMRLEIYGCHSGFTPPDPGCTLPLGLENEKIPDSAFTATSMKSTNLAKSARLNKLPEGSNNDGWCAINNNPNEYLTVDFGKVTKVTRIAIQGLYSKDWWTSTYKLSYSFHADGYFIPYKNDQVLKGSINRNGFATIIFDPPIIARYVRLNPQAYNGNMCLRMELYGCEKGFKAPAAPKCEMALGLENKKLPDSAMTSSSYRNGHYVANRGRLNLKDYQISYATWWSATENKNQWLQINFGKWTKVTRVSTQGQWNSNYWVTKYTLSFSSDQVFYETYKQKDGNSMLAGNTDRYGTVTHSLDPPIIAKIVRFNPQTWHSYISLRVELYGCTEGFEPPKKVCEDELGMQDKTISDGAITATSYDSSTLEPKYARLFYKAENGHLGGWCAKDNQPGHFVKVDFSKAVKINRVALQGRQDANHWVTSYTLSYSQDDGIYTAYENGKEMKGSIDRNTPVVHALKPPIIARYIRVHVKGYSSKPCMRLEFFGCRKGFPAPPQPAACSGNLGLENSKVPDSHLTASSYSGNYKPNNARLNRHTHNGFYGGWAAGANNQHQFLQINFGRWVKINRIATQGRSDADQWVSMYTLASSFDGVSFDMYQQNKREALFPGNKDRFSVVAHPIVPPIIARFIRIKPQNWHSHISMRVEFYGCSSGFKVPDIGCALPLGVQGKLPDSAFTASSINDKSWQAANARLNNVARNGRQGSWCARSGDPEPWIQFDFGKAVKVVKVATQGRPDANWWVTQYTVSSSLDGLTFTDYDGKRIFTANTDRNNYVTGKFTKPIIARYIKLNIRAVSSRACLRVEFFGCESGFTAPTLPKCLNPLGMANGLIEDKQITASSEYNGNYLAVFGRIGYSIHHNGHFYGWLSSPLNTHQWLQVTFKKWTQVGGISTQGRGDAGQWVKSYTILYSYDGVDYMPYKQSGRSAVFPGNKDNYRVESHKIDPPIIAQSVRINPQTWQGHIGMRIELFGCTEGFTPPNVGCAVPLGMQSGEIPDSAITATSTYNANTKPVNARLNQKSYWAARDNNNNPNYAWLQVDFLKAAKVVKFVTQGRYDANWWTTSYSVSYSQDGLHFTNYQNGKRFDGNRDRNSYKVTRLEPAIIARFIRIHPRSQSSHIAMRVEFYGCRSGFTAPAAPKCKNALGMQNGEIPGSAVTASTEYNGNYIANNGRLWFSVINSNYYGWLSSPADTNQYLQVTFKKWTKVTGIASQGRGNAGQWVKSYTLLYTYDGIFFRHYKQSGRTAVFTGNTDSWTVKYNDISPEIIANGIRVSPQTWHGHIGMKIEVYGCTEGFNPPKVECEMPLGVQTGAIPDSAMSANSHYSAGLAPKYGRLNSQAPGPAWCSATNKYSDYLQIDFGKAVKITRMAIQGRYDANQWVTQFSLAHSQNGNLFETYEKGKILTGNRDRNTPKVNEINPAIIAQVVRIFPRGYSSHVCMRVEFYGCSEGFKAPSAERCSVAMGMENFTIPNSAISASSIHNGNYEGYEARLNAWAGKNGLKSGGWKSKTNDMNQWLQIKFGKWVELTHVATQGLYGVNNFVKSYTLAFSYDGVFYESNKQSGRTKVFDGNKDYYGVVMNKLDPPLVARAVRIIPQSWTNHIGMRVDFYGCGRLKNIPVVACADPLGMRDRRIADSALSASTDSGEAAYGARWARLDMITKDGNQGGWCVGANNEQQFLQVDLGNVTKITRIATQGRYEHNYWTKDYTLSSSLTGGYFDPYNENKKLIGNMDRNMYSAHILDKPIIARYLRFHPKLYVNLQCVRMELFGCRKGFAVPKSPKCEAPLGIENKELPDSAFVASTFYNGNYQPYFARLNSLPQGWRAHRQDQHQWLQVNFPKWTKVSSISTQGLYGENTWTKSYTLSFSYNGIFFDSYKQGGRTAVFQGNKDRYTIVNQRISPEIVCRSIRIHPQDWQSYPGLRIGVYGCTSGFAPPDPGCTLPLGVADREVIPDSSMLSSSEYNAEYAARNGRLNLLPSSGVKPCWSPKDANENQFLQVDFGKAVKVTRFAIQGRQDANWWTKSYTLKYSQDGGYFVPYKNNAVLDGNTDRNNVKTHVIEPAIIARYIRIHPKTYQGHPALRVEFLGCTKGFTAPKPPTCGMPLGLENMNLSNSAFTSSSIRNGNYQPWFGRLNYMKMSGWWPAAQNTEQWLQVTLNQWTKITRVSTQGMYKESHWVTKYVLQYSYNAIFFDPYKQGGRTKVFAGNKDRYATVSNAIDPPIICRAIRINPQEWHSWPGLRLGLYGCTSGFTPPDPGCTKPLGMMDPKVIKNADITASTIHSAPYAAFNGRLNLAPSAGVGGGWAVGANNWNQYLQVDFGVPVKVTRFASQGRQDADWWVKSYTLSSSVDGGYYTPYQTNKVLRGNIDRNNVKTHVIEPAIIARYVRVYPREYQGHMCMRVEFLGCRSGFTTPTVACGAALGLENKKLEDSAFDASSFSGNYKPHMARLNLITGSGRYGGWRPASNNDKEWLRVNFGKWVKLTRISTQGDYDGNGWVKSYKLGYSYDGVYFRPYVQSGVEAVFHGNKDRYLIESNKIDPPIITRQIRVMPQSWNGFIGMRVDFYGCTEGFKPPVIVCAASIGLSEEERKIPDIAFSASSFKSATFAARYGRLNLKAGNGHDGSWCTKFKDQEQYIQFDLGKITKITRIATQGRENANHWMKKYKLSSSMDGGYFVPYENAKKFIGNHNRKEYKVNGLEPAIIARYLRVHQVEYHGEVCGRIELFGCTSGFDVPPVPKCMQSMGMQSGQLPDAQITSYTETNAAWRAANGRLYFEKVLSREGAWRAGANDVHQWFQVDFGGWAKIVRVSTQGRHDGNEWVKSYTLSFGYDGVFFEPYKQSGRTAPFIGNTDRNGVVSHLIAPPIIARYIRINPQAWQSHISLRADFYGCRSGFKPPEVGCTVPLGVQDTLPDSAFTASTQANDAHGPRFSRLNMRAENGHVGAWCSKTNDIGQWIKVDFGQSVKITRFATQGRQDANHWLTQYWLSYSHDDGHFQPYDKAKVFTGNRDRKSYAVHKLEPPITARYVKINVKAWNGHVCTRMEFFGCKEGFDKPTAHKCQAALGLENGNLPDGAFSASSEVNAHYPAANARLHFHEQGSRYAAWMAGANDVNQWLQVDFPKWTKFTRVATQGRQNADHWVKSYSIMYSYDSVYFEPYKQSGRSAVFNGNSDRYTVVSHEIKPEIIARSLQIRPQTWHGHIAMRLEFYGCTEGFKKPDVGCTLPLGMQSKDIPDASITASTFYNDNYSPAHSRLRLDPGCWLAKVNDRGQFLQIDFGAIAKVTRIATQGRPDANQWVTEYTLSSSLDGGHFEPYKKDFAGNTNRNMVVAHKLKTAILARFIRVHPRTWTSHIAMRVEFFGCKSGFEVPAIPKCHEALGLQSGKVKDDKFTASTYYNANNKPQYARLHLHAKSGVDGSWAPSPANKYQWLQVDFENAVKIVRVSTQGRQNADWWVKSYILSYGLDGIFFEEYQVNGKVEPFVGNTDRVTISSHVLDPPILARYVRINPQTWHGHPALRAEFYGCRSGFAPPNPAPCRDALGMENKKIKDAALKSSSDKSDSFKPVNGRLNSKKHCWSPAAANSHQWFQADFGQAVKLTGIATQGRFDADWWIISYTLTYSQDGLVFDNYENKKELVGNMDRLKVNAQVINPPIVARFIRVVPKNWHGHPALRVEFYGCRTGFIAPPPPACVDALGMENGLIANNWITASSEANSAHGAANARLNFKAGSGRTGSWSAAANDVNQWLQVDFERMMMVSRVALQGRQDADQWVKTYTLTSSLIGKQWDKHLVDGKEKIFDGNWDRNTIVIQSVEPQIIAQYVKIHPKTWRSHISLRAEFWGCEGEVPIITTPIISGVVGGGGKRRRKRANTTPGVKCEFGVRDNPLVPKGKEAKYEMQWVVNGQRKPAFELDKGQRSAQIQCGEQGYKIGDQVSCGVRGKFVGKEHWSSFRSSQNFESSVTVDPQKITVSEGSSAAEAKICSNIPACCDDPDKEECSVTLQIEPNDQIVTSNCEVTIKPGQRCTTFKLRAIRDFLDDGNSKTLLKFKPVKAPNCPCWDGFQVPPIEVSTVDSGQGTCVSTGDPHTTTFDGKYYDYYKGAGPYVFVKSLTRPFEVHSQIKPCGRVMCNCGVAAREGNDVIAFDGCGGGMQIVQKSTEPGFSDRVKVTRNGRSVKARFKSGAEVEAFSYGSWGTNLKVTVVGEDKENTVGLCGNFNGNPADDMEGKSLYTWGFSYKLPYHESLFRKLPPKHAPKPDEKFDCECKYEWGISWQECDVRPAGAGLDAGEKVDPIPADGGGIIDPAALNNPPQGGNRKRQVFKFPTDSGITEAQAKEHCRKVLEDSPIGKACKGQKGIKEDETMHNCVEDIKIMDDLDQAKISLAGLLEQCKDAIKRNPANYPKTNGTTSGTSGAPISPMLDVLCPNECSGHGKCAKGKCTCEAGFFENDCSKDINTPPKLTKMLKSCDVKLWPCKLIAIMGDGFVDYEKLSCHQQRYILFKGKWVKSGKEAVSKATYDNGLQARCHLAINYVRDRKFVAPLKIAISVSNNGKAASNKLNIFIYDSNCFKCSQEGNCARFKNHTCVIDGICYTHGEQNAKYPTDICDPTKSTDSWTMTQARATPKPRPLKTQLVGCFKDDDDRALPLLLGYFKSVEKCAAAAEARRYSIFAVQNKEQCWSGPDAMETYDKHGKATNCKDGKGGEDANSVYFVTREDDFPTVKPPPNVYSSLGCFEIKKKFLGNVESVHACFAKANKDMYKVFGIKNQKECWASESGVCANGKGGAGSSDLYSIHAPTTKSPPAATNPPKPPTTAAPPPTKAPTTEKPPTKKPTTKVPSTAKPELEAVSLGCFLDDWDRALPKYLGNHGKKDCFEMAKGLNWKYFAIQNHKECWSGSDDKVDYDKHGKSDKCTDGTGGPWSNDVYEIAVVDPNKPKTTLAPTSPPPPPEVAIPLGCYKDSQSRALPKYLGDAGSVKGCKLRTMARKWKTFAIQNHRECWSGPDDQVKHNKHGKSDKCTEGTGGPWANSVYKIAADPLYIGCYEDHGLIRALPDYLGSVNVVESCRQKAKAKGFTVFGIQDGHECWSGLVSEASARRHGSSNKCQHGLGGPHLNSLYRVE